MLSIYKCLQGAFKLYPIVIILKKKSINLQVNKRVKYVLTILLSGH
jgi:hypothetical protein